MATFTVYYSTVASFGLEVEAEDEDEARDLADQKVDEIGWPNLCGHCTGVWRKFESDPPGIDLGEWQPIDGEEGVYRHSTS
ncbi:MAG TPA: hypothetical protein VHK27_15055 [Gammaproteobacteria bacterium]|nr:hypothetical protein [Gammaproteobacteria bacterium]